MHNKLFPGVSCSAKKPSSFGESIRDAWNSHKAPSKETRKTHTLILAWKKFPKQAHAMQKKYHENNIKLQTK